MTVFFTSDTHFNHANVIKYNDRPFKDIQEMNWKMVENWNSRVAWNDTVYHLGDFGMGGSMSGLREILNNLGGIKHLIRGNHDHKSVRQFDGWASVKDYDEIKIDGQRIVLMHYAMKVWNGAHRGTIQLYGHSHGNLPGNSRSLDVGVDCWDYMPITFPEIKARLSTLPEWEPQDHHGRNE